MEQEEAIAILAEAAHRAGALVVSEIGSQTCWLHASGDHDSHLYLSGPMGAAAPVALGVALALPRRPVLALCGDGALAMNFSALVTMSAEAPANLTIAVMDNGVYDFTGQLPSPSAAVDWLRLISGLPGFRHVGVLAKAGSLALRADAGLSFIHVRVAPARRKPPAFPFSGREIYRRFAEHVRLER